MFQHPTELFTTKLNYESFKSPNPKPFVAFSFQEGFGNPRIKKFSRKKTQLWDPGPFDSLRLATVPSNLWNLVKFDAGCCVSSDSVIREKWWSLMVDFLENCMTRSFTPHRWIEHHSNKSKLILYTPWYPNTCQEGSNHPFSGAFAIGFREGRFTQHIRLLFFQLDRIDRAGPPRFNGGDSRKKSFYWKVPCNCSLIILYIRTFGWFVW